MRTTNGSPGGMNVHVAEWLPSMVPRKTASLCFHNSTWMAPTDSLEMVTLIPFGPASVNADTMQTAISITQTPDATSIRRVEELMTQFAGLLHSRVVHAATKKFEDRERRHR